MRPRRVGRSRCDPTGRPARTMDMILVRRNAVRHRVTTLVGGVLITAVTICGATPAGAAALSTRDRAAAAAGWLARQMAGGERFESTSGGFVLPDQNLTVDAVFAFAA